MLELLAYLQDSELVARFQRCCGLYLIREGAESHHNMSRNQTCRTGTAHKDEACGQPRQRFDNNSNAEYKENGHCVKNGRRPEYEVRTPLLHLLFLFSSGLGHEVFYISCLPWLHWNLDPFLCRRLVNMWTVVMYVGQVLKDLLKLPRPLSPPVVKLEKRVVAEYGLPSTHAMAATAISFTFLYSAPSRIQFPFEVGLIIAVTLSSLVCLSRIYTGMHSVLDVICGLFISSCILFVTYPFWDTFDHYQLTSPFSPVFGISLPLLLSYTYPKLDHYSTTRGDTTTILGVCAGCSVGYWFNVQLGETFEPKEALPVPLPEITTTSFTYGTVRFVLGVLALVGTRQLVKMFSLHVLYWIYKVPKSDLNARKRKEIEVPYKFVTYTSVGLVNSILVNRAFVYMGLL
ncbi:sphingosine-1-phosphate phosphatase 2 isoform X1 [Boleophthalmus pectinirostris]|uniref:sphingosine-1-phosphate phosphatase 2 isoform X1 n=1 Tax=Boleophthalmus pectinirostris TaxID=150288 RepID=UPI000A1C4974|nr:sphingosine-1-phosphate phosphatase 2 isoform X1 [Boleophthalmus pectinirostris]